MSAKELKESLTNRLSEAGLKLVEKEKMTLAISLDINLGTIKRYMSGKKEEVRKLELAETILEAAEKLINEKAPA